MQAQRERLQNLQMGSNPGANITVRSEVPLSVTTQMSSSSPTQAQTLPSDLERRYFNELLPVRENVHLFIILVFLRWFGRCIEWERDQLRQGCLGN